VITYTTHGEVTFISHLPFLAARWAAPISMGLYVPGTDFNLAVKCIAYARWCHPEVKRWVTFHMIFGEGHFPSVRVPGVREMSELLREIEAGIDCAK
jgi:N-acetyllactosaminide beta-1,3-N-acetylglucosaminyltransferase